MSDIIPFWREYEAHGYLSQWYIRAMLVDGTKFNCCEQFMMARKAIQFGDDAVLRKILAESNPFKQKKLGREVSGFDGEVWNNVCRQVVYEANLAKFQQHDDLRVSLLSTGDAILVEASPFDKIWGIGLAPDNEKVKDPSKWRGKNWLGEALMSVRAFLRQ